MHTCSGCHQEKPKEEFYAQTSRKAGVQGYCKACARPRSSAWTGRNPEKRLTWTYRRLYNMTVEQVQALYDACGGRCQICAAQVQLNGGRGKSDTAALDHCHASGTLRGILCNACNKGLGFFKDSADAMRAAALYVEAAR